MSREKVRECSPGGSLTIVQSVVPGKFEPALRPVAHFSALLATAVVATSLVAQDAAKPKAATAATGSAGVTVAKPKAKPLSIDDVEKLQAARAKAAAAKGAAGSTGVAGAAPAKTVAPAKTTTGPAEPLSMAQKLAIARGTTGTTGAAKPVAKPAAAATGTTGVVKPVPPAVTPVKQVPVVGTEKKPSVTATAPPAAAPAGPVPGVLNRTVIVLDPAHGGGDSGSRLSDKLMEKDVTLAFAFKLRSLLQARGFTVVMTRDADVPANGSSPNPLTLDDRAGVANHSRAVACLLLHATGSGSGVHVYHSELDPVAGEPASLPWLTAQAAWVAQSTALAGKLAQSFTRASIPLVSSAASVRPVDSLTCPALVVELAPKGGDVSSLDDSSYQGSVAEALAGALVFWKNQAIAPNKVPAATGTVGAP